MLLPSVLMVVVPWWEVGTVVFVAVAVAAVVVVVVVVVVVANVVVTWVESAVAFAFADLLGNVKIRCL